MNLKGGKVAAIASREGRDGGTLSSNLLTKIRNASTQKIDAGEYLR